MLTLVNINSGEIFPVLKGQKYNVGKLNADLVLLNDKSISGLHATLHWKNTKENEFLFELEDLGSKNGTFVNAGIAKRKTIPKNVPLNLMEEDRIRFGVFENVWSIKREVIYTSSSGLSADEVNMLEDCLSQLGGKHSLKWEESCTHLTMNEIRVTFKVMYALLAGVNIVTMDFWRDMLKIARKEMKGPLLLKEYVPRASDVILAQKKIDFREPMERKLLFVEKTFVFLNQKHYEQYAPIVEKAGAASRGLKSGVQKQFLLRKGVIVIQYIPSTESQTSQSTQTINSIVEYLEHNGRRLVPEYEIALAIIHGSTEKFCNPDFKIVSNILSSSSTPLQDAFTVLVENTSDANFKEPSESCDLMVFETQMRSSQATLANENAGSSNCTAWGVDYSDLSKGLKQRIHSEVSVNSDLRMDKNQLIQKKKFTISSDQNILVSNPPACSMSAYKNLNATVLKPSASKRLANFSDDEDDLFNFGEEDTPSLALAEKRRCIPSAKDHEEVNLFGFASNPKSCIEDPIQEMVQNKNISQPFVPKTVRKCSAILFPRPRVQPQKLVTSGWMTFSRKRISDVFDKKKLLLESNEDDAESFKGIFNVKTNNTLLMRVHEKSACGKEISNTNLAASDWSFKKFAKQKLIRHIA